MAAEFWRPYLILRCPDVPRRAPRSLWSWKSWWLWGRGTSFEIYLAFLAFFSSKDDLNPRSIIPPGYGYGGLMVGRTSWEMVVWRRCGGCWQAKAGYGFFLCIWCDRIDIPTGAYLVGCVGLRSRMRTDSCAYRREPAGWRLRFGARSVSLFSSIALAMYTNYLELSRRCLWPSRDI